MSSILIFDIGKTNKKAFVFNESYDILWEKSVLLEETADEDGDPCEDLPKLISWIKNVYEEVKAACDIKAVNFSSYGATLVFLDGNGRVLTPLYNYLKAYPEELKRKFYDTYGGETEVSGTTASPVLGSLNSGMLIYRLKHERPEVFSAVKRILHLPNYLSFLFSGKKVTDITSIGCHTHLWDFTRGDYHRWVGEEGIDRFLAPVHAPHQPVQNADGVAVGIGLHDSSAALIPYLKRFDEPFALLSTGTWNITINPFNEAPLSWEELDNDCLCFLKTDGKPIKASRLLGGMYHEQEAAKIARCFGVPPAELMEMNYDPEIEVETLSLENYRVENPVTGLERDWQKYPAAAQAYHQLMADLVALQKRSSDLVLKSAPVNKLFVDGGFGKSRIFMKMLSAAYPNLEVFTSEVPQASALGAALVLHDHWNSRQVPEDLIKLKQFTD